MQIGAFVTHERFITDKMAISFTGDEEYVPRCIIDLLQYDVPVVGDVGFYWINYVPVVFSYFQNTVFVCLKRMKERVLESFENHPPEQSRFFNHMNMKQISDYYDKYYEDAERFQILYPQHFKIFDIDELNMINGQNNILTFCGYTEEKLYKVPLKLNVNSA